jgi:IS5 family transposase
VQIKAMIEGAERETLKAVEKAKASVRYRGVAKNGHQLYTLFGLANVVIEGRTATT